MKLGELKKIIADLDDDLGLAAAPMILKAEDYDRWLDPKMNDAGKLQDRTRSLNCR